MCACVVGIMAAGCGRIPHIIPILKTYHAALPIFPMRFYAIIPNFIHYENKKIKITP